MATKKSKVPTRKYTADDLEVKNAGDTYKPHEGEWVEMRGGPSWSFLADSATIGRLGKASVTNLLPEESLAFVAAINRVSTFLASRIVGWNWTDATGEPLSKPTAEAIGQLEQEEVLWLISTLSGGATPTAQETETKNA